MSSDAPTSETTSRTKRKASSVPRFKEQETPEKVMKTTEKEDLQKSKDKATEATAAHKDDAQAQVSSLEVVDKPLTFQDKLDILSKGEEVPKVVRENIKNFFDDEVVVHPVMADARVFLKSQRRMNSSASRYFRGANPQKTKSILLEIFDGEAYVAALPFVEEWFVIREGTAEHGEFEGAMTSMHQESRAVQLVSPDCNYEYYIPVRKLEDVVKLMVWSDTRMFVDTFDWTQFYCDVHEWTAKHFVIEELRLRMKAYQMQQMARGIRDYYDLPGETCDAIELRVAEDAEYKKLRQEFDELRGDTKN